MRVRVSLLVKLEERFHVRCFFDVSPCFVVHDAPYHFVVSFDLRQVESVNDSVERDGFLRSFDADRDVSFHLFFRLADCETRGGQFGRRLSGFVGEEPFQVSHDRFVSKRRCGDVFSVERFFDEFSESFFVFGERC